MALVKFYTCTQEQYNTSKLNSGILQEALYFISDTKRLYKGETLYGGSFEYVAELPATGNTGTLYFAENTGNISIWNGEAFVIKFLPFETTLGNADTAVPTSKAVKTYVDAVSGNLNSALSAAIQTLDSDEVGGSGKVITTISEADGIISATAIDLTTTAVARTATTNVGGTTAEAALEDLGSKIATLNGNDTTAGSVAKAVKDAQTTLQGNIDAEATQRAADDGYLSGVIDIIKGTAETAGSFKAGDKALSGAIGTGFDSTNTVKAAIDAEETAREDADEYLSGAIDAEVTRAKAAEGTITGLIGEGFDSTNTVKAAIDAEETAREADTTFLSGAIGEGFDSTNTVKKAIQDIQAAAISISGATNTAIEITESGVNKIVGLKINANDKFLSQTSDGLSASFTLVKKAAANTAETNAAEYYLADKNGDQVGATINVPKDQFLQSASFVQGSGSGDDKLQLTFITSTGANSVVDIPLSGLFDEYEAGNGISLTATATGIQIAGVIDSTSENFLTVGSNGFKLAGVQDAIDNAASTLSTNIGAGFGPGTTSGTVAAYINTRIEGLASTTATNLAGKLDDVASGHADEIVIAKADGEVQVSGKKVGGSTIATEPTANTVATEAAVSAFVDSKISDAALVWNTL